MNDDGLLSGMIVALGEYVDGNDSCCIAIRRNMSDA